MTSRIPRIVEIDERRTQERRCPVVGFSFLPIFGLELYVSNFTLRSRVTGGREGESETKLHFFGQDIFINPDGHPPFGTSFRCCNFPQRPRFSSNGTKWN